MDPDDPARAVARTPAAGRDSDLESLAVQWHPNRRHRRDRRSDVETDILDVAEKLLAEVPLHELEVKQIIAEAGVSRTSFYMYFSSKFDVVTTLVTRAMADSLAAIVNLATDDGRPPHERLAADVRAAGHVWVQHRSVYNSAFESWHADPELGDVWRQLMDQWVELMTSYVRRDLEAGLTAVDGDLRQAVTALIWSAAQVFYLGTTGTAKGIGSMADAVDALTRLWIAVLYPSAPPLVANASAAGDPQDAG